MCVYVSVCMCVNKVCVCVGGGGGGGEEEGERREGVWGRIMKIAKIALILGLATLFIRGETPFALHKL